MIFDDVQRVADQQVTPVLPRSTSSICLLQMETQDALGDVLDKICHVDKPVLLLLPTSGDAFSRHEHFLPLRRLITKNVHPPFFCLVIPDQRVDEASLATLYGIPHAPSIEKALQLLAHFSLAIAEDPSFSAEAAALALQTLKQDDGTKELET